MSVLLVDDEPDIRDLLSERLTIEGYAVDQAASVKESIAKLEQHAYDCLVVDLRLGDGDGADILRAAIQRYPQIVAIVMTGFGGVPDAVEAIKRGGIDFLVKPFAPSTLVLALQTELERRRPRQADAELRQQMQSRGRFDDVVGLSAPMQDVFRMLERVAPMNAPVLIQGETGTGKELIARAIHRRSRRAEQRFVAFNAAAIPEALVEAELFGHARGAFTGAVNARVGRFELADRGTLFIDELALMPMALQAKLLRVLQEKEVERLGESRPIKFDARVIVATNADLRKMVKEGTFREDLYYRLNVLPVTLPPLRSRREDIPLVARHFLERSCKANALPMKHFGQSAMRCLMDYQWPGNIRELENATEHAVAMSGLADEIAPEALPIDIVRPEQEFLLPTMNIPDEGISFTSVVSQVERELISRCLQKTGGNKRQAARLLNLSRTTLIDKLHRLNLGGSAA